MLKKEDVYNCYNQYKKDINCNIALPPQILILAKKLDNEIAMVGHVESGFFELYLNEDIFYHITINKEYMYQVLYHEFTHVVDKLCYFKDEKDDKQHRSFLFPYTEFHASHIEMKKRLDLFRNPTKIITMSSNIYGIDGIETIKSFIDNEQKDFSLAQNNAYENPNIKNIQSVVYMIIYNLGFYSVLRNYNIDNRLSVLSSFPFIKDEFNNINDLLLNKIPSEVPCLQANAYAHNMTVKIASNYGLNI